MSHTFFNSFKEKLFTSDLDKHFAISAYPVNSQFFDTYENKTDISLTQFRTVSDLSAYAARDGLEFTDMFSTGSAYGILYDSYSGDDLRSKPLFVNAENYDAFIEVYGDEVLIDQQDVEIRLKKYIDPTQYDDYTEQDIEDTINANSGFYYVRTKEELGWIADRCNDDSNFNNKIRVVVGDDIGSESLSYDDMGFCICPSASRPFQGILDFNGHTIYNKNIICSGDVNGLVGYLGDRGIVRNVVLQNYQFICKKSIDLNKIETTCTDVIVGGLVGVNYGTVENVITSGEMKFNDFCPEVYLVGNKFEYSEGDSNARSYDYRTFFQNKFCINSIYNVIPYVGYFNEGADSYFNDVGTRTLLDFSDYNEFTGVFDGESYSFFTTQAKVSMGYYNPNDDTDYSMCQYQFLEPKSSIEVHDDLSQVVRYPIFPLGKFSKSKYRRISADFILKEKNSPSICGEFTHLIADREYCQLVNEYETQSSYDGSFETEIVATETYDSVDVPLSFLWKDIERGAYLTRQLRDTIHLFFTRSDVDPDNFTSIYEKITIHQRLNPASRIAYYCSPIVGNNFGTIQNVDCRHTIIESDTTFVGFIGNVCGKMNTGTIDQVTSNLSFRLNTSGENITHTYLDDRTYLPDVGSDYPNERVVFGYNYDYYQSPYFSNTQEYSANSGNLQVTSSFYTFHDFVASGVNRRYYADNNIIFNEYENSDYTDFKNCNFYVTGSTDTVAQDNPLQYYPLYLSTSSDTESTGNLYLRCIPDFLSDVKEGIPDIEFKIFRNSCKPLGTADYQISNESIDFARLTSDERGTITGYISKIGEGSQSLIEHMELCYLGDAYKTLSTDDVLATADMLNEITWDEGTGYKTITYSDGKTVVEEVSWDSGSHQITLSDVFSYCPVFSGTLSGANEFAKNIVNAKIALGANIIGDISLDNQITEPNDIGMALKNWTARPDDNVDSSSSEDYFPFSCGNYSKNDHETSYVSQYVIPAFTGPNETSSDWKIFDNGYGIPMAWYWTPCLSGVLNNHGYSDPTDPSFKRYCQDSSKLEETVNKYTNNPKGFCSTRDGEQLWDVQAPKIYDDASENPEPSTGLQRSVIDIQLRSTYEAALKNILVLLRSYSTILKSLSLSSATIFINRITIPLANRTQMTNSYRSFYVTKGTHSGETVRVCYLETTGSPMFYNDSSDTSQLTPNKDMEMGNADFAYIDVSILVQDPLDETGTEKIPYSVIIKLPVKEVSIPISSFRISGSLVGTSDFTYTTDFTTTETASGITLYTQKVCFYPYLAAFTPPESDITYTLQSIYNVGGICGMLNASESYIENGNGTTRSNTATCGTISNCKILLTDETAKSINSLTNVTTSYVSSVGGSRLVVEDVNPRTIGIANKFAPVAAIFEYHSNEVGLSSYCGISQDDYDANTDSLQDLRLGKTNLINIDVHYETEDDDISSINHFIWGGLIQWANISMMLDYTNFFMQRYSFDNRDDDFEGAAAYIAHSYSNFPESVILPMWSSNTSDCAMYGPEGFKLDAYQYPVTGYNSTAEDCNPDGANILCPYNYQYAGDDIPTVNSVKYKNGAWMRSKNSKRYHYLVGNVLNVENLYKISSDGEATQLTPNIQMSPQCNAPNSDYYDVFAPMFNGSSHLAFSKLGKATVRNAYVKSENAYSYSPTTTYDMVNDRLLSLIAIRASNISDGESSTSLAYWDYTKTLMHSDLSGNPLILNIVYSNENEIDSTCTRGLWFHQMGPWDSADWMKYTTVNDCTSDGSSISLGYMPDPDEILTLIMNYNKDPDTVEYEGSSVYVDDLNGFLLVDSSGNLVSVYKIDPITEAEGSWVINPPVTGTIDDKAYGLLAAIRTKDSTKV